MPNETSACPSPELTALDGPHRQSEDESTPTMLAFPLTHFPSPSLSPKICGSHPFAQIHVPRKAQAAPVSPDNMQINAAAQVLRRCCCPVAPPLRSVNSSDRVGARAEHDAELEQQREREEGEVEGHHHQAELDREQPSVDVDGGDHERDHHEQREDHHGE